MSPLSSSADDGTLDDADASKPAISLIVAIDQVSPGVLRSLTAMRDAVADDRVELIAATAELWPDAPSWVNVVTFNGASRGDRLDRAAEHATGELLAFTDDRVRIPDGWVREVLAVFSDPSVGVAGGPVLPRARWRGRCCARRPSPAPRGLEAPDRLACACSSAAASMPVCASAWQLPATASTGAASRC